MLDDRSDDVLEFTATEQFTSRVHYHARLDLTTEDLDRIIGKYSLPKPKASWLNCGLNGCNEPHRHGYLIRAKDGRETHCGNRCGYREFGVAFEEVVARAVRAEEARARRSVVADLAAQRTELMARAEHLVAPCAAMEHRVIRLRRGLQSFRRFWQIVEGVAKLDGAIRAEAEAPPDPTASRSGAKRTVQVTIGRIDGSRLLLAEPMLYSKVITLNVLPFLQLDLGDDQIAAADDKALATLSKQGAIKRDTLLRAERFLVDAERLLKPSNLAKLQLVRERLLSYRDVTPELLKQLGRLEREGVP